MSIYLYVLLLFFPLVSKLVWILVANISKPPKWSCLHFLLAGLVVVFLAPYSHVPSLPLWGLGQEATLAKPLNPFWNQEVGSVCVCECARVCLCLRAEVMRTGCRLWPHIPCGGVGGVIQLFLQGFFPPMLSASGQGEYFHLPKGLLRNPKYPERPCIRWKLAAH